MLSHFPALLKSGFVFIHCLISALVDVSHSISLFIHSCAACYYDAAVKEGLLVMVLDLLKKFINVLVVISL